eukprot:GGOE01013636.1.p1 GENE.GGOE01013636.1~~GGOE01013636.1.p1  ORF type:complete len:251 (+),score=42.33 GGOE01013636.1:28-753(+)
MGDRHHNVELVNIDAAFGAMPVVNKDPTSESTIQRIEEDDDFMPTVPVNVEITDIDAAKKELEGLHRQTIDLANKWQETKEQVLKQMELEAQVKSLLADAEVEIERLRTRIPKQYDKVVDDSVTDMRDLSVHAEAAFDLNFHSAPPKAYRSHPKKGVLGMEVALYGDFVQVQRLTQGGACQQAGLLEGDVIRTWNGKLINNQNDFVRATSVCGAGIPLNVEVQREGARGLLTFEVIPKRKM